MPKPKNKKDSKKDKNIKIEKSDSSLAEFVQRPVPSEAEADNFDEFVHNEIKDEEIDESLSEIYQDEKGNAVNISKMDIKKRHGFFFWLFSLVFILLIMAGAGYASYYYVYLPQTSDPTSAELLISAPDEVRAGEEFFYAVDYKNLDNVVINNIEIKLTYPDNFILTDSQPQPQKGDNIWQFNSLAPSKAGQIKIKGMMVGEQDYVGVFLAGMSYMPINFSSEFKKEAVKESIISGIGLDIEIESDSSVLVNEEREIIIRYQSSDNNYLNNFRLTLIRPENIEIISKPDKEQPGKGIWLIDDVGSEEELKIKFKVKEKINETEKISLLFEHSENGEDYYKFREDALDLEIINSDLNLTLIINGSRNDQSVDFGETLNYSIVYANKGEAEMKDVIIMAIIESDFLDWNSLDIKNGGQAKEGIIVWNKEEVPMLEALQPGGEGTVDFAINILPMEKINLSGGADGSKKYQVKSYAQFNIGGLADDSEEISDEAAGEEVIAVNEDTHSNTIVNTINSDLKLTQQLRYFNEDNIPVGSGPLPPKVGETTTYKVYWTISNNLHELNDLLVEAELPSYVVWGNKNRTTVGTLKYDSGDHKVIWEAGRLPISVEKITAEFSIGVTPVPADRNKIMVLLPGTGAKATDKETGSEVNVTTKAKTTKLDDDDIADDDGVVE